MTLIITKKEEQQRKKNVPENLKRSPPPNYEKSVNKMQSIGSLSRSLSVDSGTPDNLQDIMMDMQPESDIQKVEDYSNNPSSPYEKSKESKQSLTSVNKNGTVQGGMLHSLNKKKKLGMIAF